MTSAGGGYGSGGDDFAGMGAGVRGVADDLRRTGDELRHAAEVAADLQYETESYDGLIRVAVDGRPRLVSLRLHPNMLGADPDAVDVALTTTINEALTQARSNAQAALLDGLAPSVRSTLESLIDNGGQQASHGRQTDRGQEGNRW